MRRVFLSFALYLFIVPVAFFAFGQKDKDASSDKRFAIKPISLEDRTFDIGGDMTAPALSVNVPESDVKEVLKEWEKTIRNKTKSKPVQQGDGFFLHRTMLEEVSPDPVNVFYSCFQEGEDVRIVAAFEMGRIFVDEETKPVEYAQASSFLRAFSAEQYKESAEDVLKEEEKKLRDLERELKKLSNDKEKLEKTIKTNTINIGEMEKEIEHNEANADINDGKILTMMGKIPTLSGAVKEQQEEELKNLKQEQKKLKRDRVKTARKITSSEAEIRDAKRELKRNTEDRVTQKARIEAQSSVVDKLMEKTRGIK